MLSENLTSKLNTQINLELYSANLYTQMNAWCACKGYDGCATYFGIQAQEEKMHMEKLFQYVLETGGMPELGAVKAPPTDWGSIKEVFQATLAHERAISQEISTLVELAHNEKDFSTFQFLQWYVAEQHEEEHKLSSLLDRIDLITAEGHGLFTIDREVSRLAGSPSA